MCKLKIELCEVHIGWLQKDCPTITIINVLYILDPIDYSSAVDMNIIMFDYRDHDGRQWVS